MTPENKLAPSRPQQTFQGFVESQLIPIAGFTEHNSHRIRIPREGKLRLGVKVPNASGNGEHPVATDYIVLPDRLRDDPQFREVLAQCNENPDKPRRIPIWLVSNNPNENIWPEYNRYAGKAGLMCRSKDGLTARCKDPQTGEYSEIPCANINCPHYTEGRCILLFRMQFFIPDAPGLGAWQLDTKSRNNYYNIVNQMAELQGTTGNRIAGFDLFLSLEPTSMPVPIDPQRPGATTVKDVWLLNLRSRVGLRDLLAAVQRAASNVTWSVGDIDEVDTSYDEIAHATAAECEDPSETQPDAAKEAEPEDTSSNTHQAPGCQQDITALLQLAKEYYGKTAEGLRQFKEMQEAALGHKREIKHLSAGEIEKLIGIVRGLLDLRAQNGAQIAQESAQKTPDNAQKPPLLRVIDDHRTPNRQASPTEDDPHDPFMADPFACADCGKTIDDVTFTDKSVMTSDEIIERAENTYGRSLCYLCMTRRDAATARKPRSRTTGKSR